MADINSILRRSVLVDTSNSEPPRGIQMVATLGGGVYSQADDEDVSDSVLAGRLSLGILAALVLGAVAFYVWTNTIQGGG